MRIVLGGGFLASYLDGGGHWMGFLQYPLALRALGHEVTWLEILPSTGDRERDLGRVRGFFARMADHGLAGRSILVLHGRDDLVHSLDAAEVHGASPRELEAVARSADVIWNFASKVRPPLLAMFSRRVLVDGDPGHLQVAGQEYDFAIGDHDAFLTVGTKLHDPDCEVPTLGVRWRPFLPPIHLPLWDVQPDPGPGAPFTSVTQWTWEELRLGERVLSVSKRHAYMALLEAPRRAGRPVELAANMPPEDADRDALLKNGWTLVDPHAVAGTPDAYRRYIARSRAELGCPKPIHRALRTGWFSDRSACYLASGRPVLFEDTGIGDRLPTGTGLVLFRNVDEVVDGVKDIDARWSEHSRAARRLAEEHLDARRVLPAMLEASFG